MIVGRKWMKGFLRRHREITFRTPETVSSASAKVKEADIRGWFANLKSYLEENCLMAAALDPTRIYNGDETSFFLHPQTKTVLASRGSKNVYEIEHADGHKNITVMFTFGADGSVVSPGVVLPMQRLSVEILRSFPGDWGVGKSPKGWMDTTNFMLYIRNVFYPHLQKKKVRFPVLYFVDGHSSHTAAEVADLCLDLGIVLIALYPNTTRITQPADVAIFKPLKTAWKSAVADWRMEYGGQNLLLKDFPGVLQKAMDGGIKKHSITNGFRVCGLYPFGADYVDYGKCIAKSVTQRGVDPTSDCSASDNGEEFGNEQAASETVDILPELNLQFDAQSIVLEDSVIIPTATVHAAIDCIGRDRINGFGDDFNSSEEGEIIRTIYEMLLKPFDSQNTEAECGLQETSFLNTSTAEEDSAFVENVEEGSFESDPPHNPRVLQDCNGDNFAGRKMSISELLQTPPTPQRSSSHRNYKRKFHPVLTASERLEEIRRLEEEKENEVVRKKAKAEERELAKIEAEKVKQEKAKARKQKQAETEMRKIERAELRKRKQEETEQRKKKKEKDKLSKVAKDNQQKQLKMELQKVLKLQQQS